MTTGGGEERPYYYYQQNSTARQHRLQQIKELDDIIRFTVPGQTLNDLTYTRDKLLLQSLYSE
jgi:hypothetical protein